MVQIKYNKYKGVSCATLYKQGNGEKFVPQKDWWYMEPLKC